MGRMTVLLAPDLNLLKQLVISTVTILTANS